MERFNQKKFDNQNGFFFSSFMMSVTLFSSLALSCQEHRMSSERSIRAWALINNFSPYRPRSRSRKHYVSPAHKINGFVYEKSWLRNLLMQHL